MSKDKTGKRRLRMAHKKIVVPTGPALSSVLESWTFYGLFGLLLLGPLMFGAVEPWAIFVLEAGTALLCLMWVGQQATASEINLTWHPLFAPMLAFASLVVIQIAIGRSAYYFDTSHVARLYCAYGALCFLVVQLIRNKAQLKQLAIAFCGYGFAVAIFGLLQSLSSTGQIYWIRTIPNASIYGPYINRSHYAGLMEMLVPVPLVLSFTSFTEGSQKTMARVAAAVMASTIFLSKSRGGMVAFVVEMAMLAVILARQKQGKTVALSLGIFLALIAGLLIWLGGSELNQRLVSIKTETTTELQGGTRMDINRDALLRMFPQKPVLGWGLGAFPEVYPRYRTFFTDLYINEAHNDYLQLLVEMGAAGFVAMLWFVGAMYYRAIRKMKNWSSDPNGTLGLIAMLGCTGILVHSFVDFNLQIPANAALFYVWCVIAALDPRFPSHQRRLRVASREVAPALVVR